MRFYGQAKQLRWDIFHIERGIINEYYHRKRLGIHSKNRYVLMCDGIMNHGGFFDRMKGTISIYALSKVQNREFKLYFVNPFHLQEYLIPNQYDWSVSQSELCYDYPYAKPVVGYFEFDFPWRMMLKRKGEVHYYFGYNILDRINKRYHTDFTWRELYNELFTPSERLRLMLSNMKQKIGGKYIAVHIRFLNMLGDNNESDSRYTTLSPGDQDKLVRCCISQIKNIIHGTTKKVILSTDSNVFMQRAQTELPDVFVVPGTIRHIDNTTEETNVDENLKLFVDYYLLAGAEHIYSIVGNGLYRSDFPYYSSIIGGGQFSRVNLEDESQ